VVGRPLVTAVRLDTEARIGIARWNRGDPPGRRLAVFSAGMSSPTDHPSICSALFRPVGAGGAAIRFRAGASGCGLRHAPEPGDVVAVAQRVSPSGRWLQALAPGTPILVRVETGLPTVSEAFGGTPALVRQGRVVNNRCGPLICKLHPRTAAGLTLGCLDDDATTPCRLLIVIVDGRRSSWSIGMTTEQLARLMVRLGATEAVNLDGGASSQVLIRGRMQNRPAPGARRVVVSALIIRRMPDLADPRRRQPT
jgi:hypothetical protein